MAFRSRGHKLQAQFRKLEDVPADILNNCINIGIVHFDHTRIANLISRYVSNALLYSAVGDIQRFVSKLSLMVDN